MLPCNTKHRKRPQYKQFKAQRYLYIPPALTLTKSAPFPHGVLACAVRFLGERGSAFRGDTALHTGRSQVRFPIVSLKIFIHIILPAALWLWGRLSL